MEYNFCINGILFQEKNINLEVLVFPGGEPHIKLDQYAQILPENIINISTRLNSFNDLGKLLVLCDAIQRMQGKIGTIYIPYFPGARQDKKIFAEAFTVKIYTDLINRLHANEIVIYDPHSEVTPALLNNAEIITQKEIWGNYIKNNIIKNQDFVFISPDTGATKKIELIADKKQIVYCTKKRDPKTGNLSHFEVGSGSLKGKKGIIIDDICDGGGTFVGLAKRLHRKGIDKLILCVTHGIFSKGFETLWQYYDDIHTTNSIREDYPPQIKINHLCLKKIL